MPMYKHALAGLAAALGLTGGVVALATVSASTADAATVTTAVPGDHSLGCSHGWRCWGGHHGRHGRQKVKFKLKLHSNNNVDVNNDNDIDNRNEQQQDQDQDQRQRQLQAQNQDADLTATQTANQTQTQSPLPLAAQVAADALAS